VSGKCQLQIEFYDQSFQIPQSQIEDATADIQQDCFSELPLPASGHAQINDGPNSPWALRIGAPTPSKNKGKRDSSTWTTAYTIEDAEPAAYRVQVFPQREHHEAFPSSFH
jgi:hypothetical protein